MQHYIIFYRIVLAFLTDLSFGNDFTRFQVGSLGKLNKKPPGHQDGRLIQHKRQVKQYKGQNINHGPEPAAR